MPLQNRVQPGQSIQAMPRRGLLAGNRGILHDAERTLRRAWASKAWIGCTLDWKGTRRVQMSPGTWTELFFLDEAVALAAGHRPCTLCRRAAFRNFQSAWMRAGLPGVFAPQIDAHLHAHRRKDRRLHHPTVAVENLPDFTFVSSGLASGAPLLLIGPRAHPLARDGYRSAIPRPTGLVRFLTPMPSVATLAAGYRPLLHPDLLSDQMPQPDA